MKFQLSLLAFLAVALTAQALTDCQILRGAIPTIPEDCCSFEGITCVPDAEPNPLNLTLPARVQAMYEHLS
jgi:hypothetical protein